MTYSIAVYTTEAGTSVTTSGDVPLGGHQIDGHEDSGQVSVQVTRRDQSGRYVTAAQHHHIKEQ